MTGFGRNTGKKYIKLIGYEVAKPENEAKARDFMRWYSQNIDKIKHYILSSGVVLNEDIMTESLLTIYNAISLKGANVKSYMSYYIHSYRMAFMASKKSSMTTVDYLSDTIEAEVFKTLPEYNSEYIEEEINSFYTEIMNYVRENYNEIESSVFELYIGLYPAISYRKLSKIFGLSFSLVWTVIGKIKKDVVSKFNNKVALLLTDL